MSENLMPDFCNRRFPFHYTTALCVLMKMGLDITQVDILAVGEFENYKGEVIEQEPPPGKVLTSETTIRLKIGYPSAVDFMPYQFFYGLTGSAARSSDWEERARELMAPFDSPVIRHNAAAEYQTLKFDMGLIDDRQVASFLDLFGFELRGANSEHDRSLIWITLMPFFHFWAGNGNLTARALSLIFGYEFEIVENVESEFEIPRELQYHLGSLSGRLGRETIVGKSFLESDSTFGVTIKGITPEEIKTFLPGGGKRKQLEAILAVCMPNHLEYIIKFDVARRRAVIGREKQAGYLGYAMHI